MTKVIDLRVPAPVLTKKDIKTVILIDLNTQVTIPPPKPEPVPRSMTTTPMKLHPDFEDIDLTMGSFVSDSYIDEHHEEMVIPIDLMNYRGIYGNPFVKDIIAALREPKPDRKTVLGHFSRAIHWRAVGFGVAFPTGTGERYNYDMIINTDNAIVAAGKLEVTVYHVNAGVRAS